MIVFSIVLLGAILRLINLNQSLWWDEAINVVYAKTYDFWWFLTNYPLGDFHPPLWFAVLWIWGHIFGFSEIAVRLPSVILGTITVWLTFLLGKELFSQRVGVLAALFLAINPLHVYYSQEARMYVLAAYVSVLSFYFLNRLVYKKKWASLGYIASVVLVLYSDYLAYLIIPAQIIYLLWVGKEARIALISLIPASVTLLPWLSIFFGQLKAGITTATNFERWAEVVGGANIKNLLLIPVKTIFGRITFWDKNIYGILIGVTGAIFGSLFILGVKRIDQSTKLLISWIFIPIVLAFLISFYIPVLSYFRMLFILPAFYLILGKGIEGLHKRFAQASLIFVCLVSMVSLLIYYSDAKFQRENWRGAINFVLRNLDDDTLVVFENNEIPAPAKYYSNDLRSFRVGLKDSFADELVDKKRIFLFEYLVDIYDPKRLVERKLEYLNFVETKTYDFQGVGFVKLYVK